MSDFLQQMARTSTERAESVGAFSSKDFDRPVVPLVHGRFDVIAEIKQHSPAEGALASDDQSRVDRASDYASGGAIAISVLTEPTRFSGALEHVSEIAAALPETPIMRKDFLVDTNQVVEARAAGASGVLLITTMLSDDKLQDMLACAREHGLFVLLESFDVDDLVRSERVLSSADRARVDDGQLLFGVNTRDLRTLEVDPDRLQTLSAQLPAGHCVAESGLHTAADAATVAGYGYSMALVGTALMRASEPQVLVAAMKEAGAMGIAA